MSESIIDAETAQAYRETEYRVHGDEPFTLRVGEMSLALGAAQRLRRVDCSAFVTAYNPFSQTLNEHANAARHEALRLEIDRRGHDYVAGIGQHPSNQWPGEASYLIFGLSLEAAKELGIQLEQNAIIWAGADAVPQLILLR